MNAYEKALSLGISGTPEFILSRIKPITNNPINLSYLMELLNFRGMLRKTDGSGGQERWVGTLQNLKGALVSLGDTASVQAYEMWFSHVTNPRQLHWDTTIPDYAIPFAAMESNFAGLENMPSAQDFAAIVELGGGRPYKDVSVDDYNSMKAIFDSNESLRSRKNLIRSQFDSILNQIGTIEEHEAKLSLQSIVDSLE